MPKGKDVPPTKKAKVVTSDSKPKAVKKPVKVKPETKKTILDKIPKKAIVMSDDDSLELGFTEFSAT